MMSAVFQRRASLLLVIAVALVGVFTVLAEPPPQHTKPKPGYTSDGKLIRPEGYREWVYVGTPLTPNDLNPPEAAFPEFHNVYIHPDDFEHYSKTGEFPDGTVIIKELVSVGSKQAVSGIGYFMGEFVGLEATIKDSKRFPDEPGYWAYFSFGHSYPLADTAEKFHAPACNACHVASAADDLVFTQYYPVLRAAKGAKSGRAMDSRSEEFQKMAGAMSGAMAGAMAATAETARVNSVVPTEKDRLFRYLQGGSYKEFAAKESAAHPTRGPHTKFGLAVRVFLDPKLDASLRAGNASHPAGSAAVKEMYDASGNLQGWAVMVKTQAESDGGKGWYWYENTSTTSGSNPVAAGNGVTLCLGCPFPGKDFVLSGYPPK